MNEYDELQKDQNNEMWVEELVFDVCGCKQIIEIYRADTDESSMSIAIKGDFAVDFVSFNNKEQVDNFISKVELIRDLIWVKGFRPNV